MSKLWMVRAGKNSLYVEDFLAKNIVAIDWRAVGDLTNAHTRSEIGTLVKLAYSEANLHQAASSTGQIYRFRTEMQCGDMIMTYQANTRAYHIGVVSTEYKFTPELGENLLHSRGVKWTGKVQRDALTAGSKNSLGSISTIFSASATASEELRKLLNGKVVPSILSKTSDSIAAASESQDEESIREDTEQRAIELMQDRLNQINWQQMQELVAGLLRAMGYRTRVSAAGPDRGRDIVASPDGFGFQQPRILVEVKHRKGTMGAQEIRSFTGGLRQHDSGLYVSTGGFTKEAKYEAERSNHPLALMDLADLSSAIWEHYEQMDAQTRALLPMRRIYWPL